MYDKGKREKWAIIGVVLSQARGSSILIHSEESRGHVLKGRDQGFAWPTRRDIGIKMTVCVDVNECVGSRWKVERDRQVMHSFSLTK